MTDIVYNIHVVAEGATEREACKILYEREILNPDGKPIPPDWRSTIGSREGYEKVIQTLRKTNVIENLRNSPKFERLLLIFDQENVPSPVDRANQISSELGLSFHPVKGFANLFEHNEPDKLRVVLHISDVSLGNVSSRDFDGYILQLLQGAQKSTIAQKLAPEGKDGMDLLRKAENELTTIMTKNGYPWTHNKSWLYAYITVFQSRQSHVWFAGRILKIAPEEELKSVFAPLIEAWNRLLKVGSL